MKKPIAWSIGNIDPTGVAGALVDLETFKNLNVEARAVITAVTVKNTLGVTAIESISSAHVVAQCNAFQKKYTADSIKIGMLGTIKIQNKILQFLESYSGFSVLEPIFYPNKENSSVVLNEKQYLGSLIRLFPYVDVLTPNRTQAEKILNRRLISYKDIQEAAHDLLAFGAKSIFLTGGHVEDNLLSQDYWTNGQESFWLSNKRMSNKRYCGTGCMLAAAIAAALALNYSMKDALVIAKMYLNRGIRNSIEIVKGTVKLAHGVWPENQIDLPYLSATPMQSLPRSFKTCYLGLYPIVNRSDWLEKLLPLGVKTIQLRIKDLQGKQLEKEIKRSVILVKKYTATLFINDHWELAIKFGADGVHLGQEDLLQADIAKIRQSGLYLGISTHCYYEIAAAHTFNPSYVACGPIYFTSSKVMRFKPQGIKQLQRWRRTLQYPLVAIGGISLERLPSILKTNIEGVSLISAITKAADPGMATKKFLKIIKEHVDG